MGEVSSADSILHRSLADDGVSESARAMAMKWKAMTVAVLLSLALGACVSSGEYRERQDAELARFEAHAGKPIKQIRTFQGIDRWQSLSPEKLVIWTSVNRAYLLTLRAPCSGLEFQQTIGISSSNSIIDRHFDKIYFENQVCFLAEIRPVDYKAMKQDRRAKADASS
jgi:hypothetical protein